MRVSKMQSNEFGPDGYADAPKDIDKAIEESVRIADFLPPLDELKRNTKRVITLRLDQDVLDWFRSGRRGYQTRINMVLRAYMQAHSKEKT